MVRAVLWTALVAALASISLVAPSPQRVEEHVLRRTSSYLGRGLLQIGAEDNTAFYAEEEENQDRTSEEEENEAKYKALSLKEQAAHEDDYGEAYEQEQGDAEELELEEEEAASEWREEEEAEQQDSLEQAAQMSSGERERLEKEEDEQEQRREEGVIFVSNEEGTSGVSSKGREGSSAKETEAKLNSTSNTTGSAIPYDEELERAINAHGQGGAVSQLQTGSTEEYEEEVLEGDEANLKALNEDSVPDDLEHTSTGFEEELEERESTGNAGKGSSDTIKENFVKTSSGTFAAAPESGSGRNTSLMAQVAIQGASIGSMVKDHSSSIAGVIGLLVAGGAGIAVAVAGISLYNRFRNRRAGSKGLPRIIEIGALSRKQKSPSYSRVGERGADPFGTSSTHRPDHDTDWEGNKGDHELNALNSGSGMKHKRAWDWDADW